MLYPKVRYDLPLPKSTKWIHFLYFALGFQLYLAITLHFIFSGLDIFSPPPTNVQVDTYCPRCDKVIFLHLSVILIMAGCLSRGVSV